IFTKAQLLHLYHSWFLSAVTLMLQPQASSLHRHSHRQSCNRYSERWVTIGKCDGSFPSVFLLPVSVLRCSVYQVPIGSPQRSLRYPVWVWLPTIRQGQVGRDNLVVPIMYLCHGFRWEAILASPLRRCLSSQLLAG